MEFTVDIACLVDFIPVCSILYSLFFFNIWNLWFMWYGTFLKMDDLCEVSSEESGLLGTIQREDTVPEPYLPN